jgi:hypothetical protein
MTDRWTDWWRRRGDDRLALLLWAVWNPIGPVPLDEYASYTGRVASLLRKARAADAALSTGIDDISDFLQRQRNVLRASSASELSTMLADLRERQMGISPDPDADRHAAETLLDWYEWEMDELDRATSRPG